jgi:hypothetical protein
MKPIPYGIQPAPHTSRRTSRRLVILLAIAAFFFICVLFHLLPVNSEYYYTWNWKWSPTQVVYPIMLLLAIPFFAALLIYPRHPRLALALIAISAFALMIGGALSQKDPPSFSRITDVIVSRWSTGYFATAVKFVHKQMPIRELLRQYPTLLDDFYLHPRQKPPGLLLSEIAIVHLFGDGNSAAMISGLLIGVISSLSVVSTYFFIAVHTENRNAAFFGAAAFALFPSFLLFFPDSDPIFPNFTCWLAILWALALKRNNWLYAAGFGLLYAIAFFFTHLVGVLAIFFLGYTLVRSRIDPNFRWPPAFKYLGISLVFLIIPYLILWLITGFDPIATLIACARQNALLWSKLIKYEHWPVHSLPWTFFTDLYGFALGSAWISFLLVIYYFRSAIKTAFTPEAQVTLACVSQFLFIAIFGILQTESARIWIFMYPMLALPIGLELATWPPKHRLAVYAAFLLVMTAMCQSMEFVTSAR